METKDWFVINLFYLVCMNYAFHMKLTLPLAFGLSCLTFFLSGCTAPSTTPKVSTVDQQVKCAEFGTQNYKNSYMDDGYIKFEYHYSPSMDTCILQREEFGPDPNMYVYKLYNMFTKELLLYYATFDGLGCSSAKTCVKTMEEFNDRKADLLGA